MFSALRSAEQNIKYARAVPGMGAAVHPFLAATVLQSLGLESGTGEEVAAVV